ncbi:histidine kinase [Streptomyces sp. H10-C2]|uniref:sensor histidine kinase n=1 Tax=unclassified Streptomyces TaxID=2593676 RepID=UPI0024BBB403|nr:MULTISPECIES: histidine kinase [unclassified Streptomyces]MDJ0340034.1 histidine kinase [Streptomyces sp. PH10-H1]MDJ0369329.1 histidine kinase [Streptomyces sp. H10-C2]
MRVRPAVPQAALIALSATEVWATRSMGGSLALAVACTATAALLVRRRLPLLAFAATLPALSLGYVWLAPMAALYQVASGGTGRAAPGWPGRSRVTPRMWVTGGCAAAVAVVSFVPWPWLGTIDWEPAPTILALLLSALLATAPTALGLLGASRQELAARLDELAESREREHRLAAEQAVVWERARLAREMHDTVAHHISLIAVQSGALEVTAQSQEAREAASAVRRLSRDALDELRRMVGLLRLPVTQATDTANPTGATTRADTANPADAAVTPSGPGLGELPALLATAGPRVHGRVEAAGCPADVGHAAYRIVQESLTNVRKHATGAETEVVVRLAGGRLLVGVRNGPPGDAPAPALPSGGHGLAGLRERAAQLGGTLDASAQPDGGFLVRAVLPAG